MKKKIAIIGTAGLPATYGGFETLANYLTIHLSSTSEFTVFCPKTPKQERLNKINGANLIYLPFQANGFQSIIYDTIAIVRSLSFADSLLILGSPGTLILPLIKLFRKKVILNFGGLEWKRDKWPFIVRKYLKLTEIIGIKFADTVIVDNGEFKKYIEKEYKKDSVLIEYGGDHVSKIKPGKAMVARYNFLEKEYFVSVSRAQTDNNLHMVLEAFADMPDKLLVLVSNWNKFEYGVNLKKQYSHLPNLFLLDAIYDLNELDLIRGNAKGYIHSHSFCGTAPSLVEAMNLGLPIISYNAATNLSTTERQAEYFSNAQELKEVMQNLSDDALSQIGLKMKGIANRRYTWKIISEKYALCF